VKDISIVDYIKGLDAMARVTPRFVTEKLDEGEMPKVVHHALETELQNSPQNLQPSDTSNNQTQDERNSDQSSIFALPPQPSEDVFDLEASRSEETHKKHQKANKAPAITDNLDLQEELNETNPLTTILPLRLLGYANETFESLAGPAAAITSLFGLNKLQDPKTTTAFKASAGNAMKAVHGETAFSPYVKSGFIDEKTLKRFELAEKASYGLVKAYVAVDSANQGVQSYRKTKEQTGDNQFAIARGAQSATGQFLWQYMASYAVPAIFIKELIYKNLKAGLTTIPNIGFGALKSAGDLPKDAKGIQKFLHPVMGRLGKVFNADFLHQGESVLSKGAIQNKKVALFSDTAAAIVAGGISLASMPVVASFLDPMFEKATHELFYKPTNKLLAKYFPESYKNQIAEYEAKKAKKDRTMSDAEIASRTQGIGSPPKAIPLAQTA
jgi:hypothetical protein